MTATIGHNSGLAFGPAYDKAVTDALGLKAREFADAAGQWKDAGAIDSDEDAERLRDFMAGAKGFLKDADNTRRGFKKPWDDLGAEVQVVFRPISDIVQRSLRLIEPMMNDYLRKKQREAAEEKRRLQAEAEAQRRHAADMAEQARRRNDVAAEIAAEVASKEAKGLEKAAKQAGKVTVKSASGGARAMSPRTQRSARILNINQLFVHYRDHPLVAETLTKLATADVRARSVDETKIPGIEIIERKVAV